VDVWIIQLIDAVLSSETGTKKCLDAEAKGVAIVNEDWVRHRIDGGNTSAPVPPAKKSSTAVSQPVFGGLNFNVAGMRVSFSVEKQIKL
jgi:hypothetical protein